MVAELEFVRNPAPEAGKNRELKLSKPEAPGRGGLIPGVSHYLSSTTQKILG